jgi:hypothetical protein
LTFEGVEGFNAFKEFATGAVLLAVKYSLEAAGKLFGVSANAMRARAKKNPQTYRVERDNAGKIWLWLDPEAFPVLRDRSPEQLGDGPLYLSPLYQKIVAAEVALKAAEAAVMLATSRADAAERARDQAEGERDHWRRMAETLAAKRWRFWPF